MVAGLLPLVVDNHAVEGCLHLARPITTEKDLDILQRVAGLGDPDALTDDLIEIHELPTPQQAIQLSFSCSMDHCEAFERGLFIAGIMVQKGVGVLLQSRCDEVHGGCEGTLFSLPIMGPIRRKSGFAIIDSDEPKEIFEAAALEELSTLHVKEDVARIGTWQAGETLARNERESLNIVGSGVALGRLQRRLMPESIEGIWYTRNS